MRSIIVGITGAVLLSACTPSNPNDGAKYFDEITPDPISLEAQQQKPVVVEQQPVTVLPPSDDANQTQTTVAASDPQTPEGIAAISDSQDFRKVEARETIESDAAKLAALKADYQVVDPTAVPIRGDEVNLAAYALQQKNAVGERVYRRVSAGTTNCGRYRKNPDAAQRAFLKAGGPKKDKLNLDPDGDGFACKWDPDIYRRLLQG